MTPNRNILLMGLRASGKSTVGAALARRQGMSFIDLDEAVLERFDEPTIADVWSRRGEGAFRAMETTLLEEVLRESGRVIALGGGTPTAPGAATLLRQAALKGDHIVYLRATPAELRARLAQAGGAGDDRPSLTGDDPLDEFETIHAARDPLYCELATRTIEGVETLEQALHELDELW